MRPSDVANTVVAAVADGALQVGPASAFTAVPASVPSGHQASVRAPMTFTPSLPLCGPGPPAKVNAIVRLVHGLLSALQARAAPVTAARTASGSTPGKSSRWTSSARQLDGRRSGTPAGVFFWTKACAAPGATMQARQAATAANARRPRPGARLCRPGGRRAPASTIASSAVRIPAGAASPDPAATQPPPPPPPRTPPSAPGSAVGRSPHTAVGQSAMVTFCQQSSTHACCTQPRIASMFARCRRGVQLSPSSCDDASAKPSAVSSVATNSVAPRSPKPRGCRCGDQESNVAPASRER